MTKPGPLKAWWRAIRPPTLLTGFAPIIVGMSISLNANGQKLSEANLTQLTLLAAALLTVALLQAGANLVNDVKDFEKGVDEGERLGPLRATQMGWLSPHLVKMGYRGCFLGALIIGLLLSLYSGNEVLILGLFCLAAAYLYSGGPFPLSHLGLGELLAMCFFGPVAVGGTAFLIAGYWDVRILLYGLAPGLLAGAMMLINNIRDIKNDRLAGKRTLAVRLGKDQAVKLVSRMIWLSYVVLSIYGLIYIPFSVSLLALTILPLVVYVFVLRPMRLTPESLNQTLKKISVLNLVYGFVFLSWAL